MKIERLVLDKVACFEHLDITFQPGQDPKKADIHILVGSNGSGKTSILMAMAQFFSLASTGIDKRLRGNDSRAFLGLGNGKQAALELWGPGKAADPIKWEQTQLAFAGATSSIGYYAGLQEHELQQYRQLSNGYIVTNQVYKDTRFDHLAFAYSGHRSMETKALEAIHEQRDTPLGTACLFQKPAPANQPDPLIQWIANNKAKAAFAMDEGKNLQADRYRESVGYIERVISQIIDKPFSFTMTYEPLRVGALVDGQDLEMDVLPDGLKSLVSWIADMLMRMDRIPWIDETPVLQRPFLLFLDEIEVHLHPAWQRKVLPAVQSLFPNAQVFISTHSPFVIASAEDAWIYPLHLDGQHSVAGDPIPSKLGSSYAAVLREVLGIEAEFAPQVEEELSAFYELRERALKGEEDALERFRSKARDLQKFGEEVYAIVAPEIRQVERRLSHAAEGSAE